MSIMHPHTPRRLACALALLGMPFVFTGTAQAQTDYFWDPTSGDSVITEGPGNLDTVTSNWTQDSGASNTTVVGNDPFNHDLVFGTGTAGSTGTITLTENNLQFGSLDFRPANGGGTYDLDLNGNIFNLFRSANTITLTEDATISDSAGGGELRIATNQFRLGSNTTLSISAVLADRTGTPGAFRLYDGGTLDLSGVNTFAGNLEVYNSSTLRVSGAGQLDSGSYAGTIALNQTSDLNYASSADQTLSGVISGNGSLEMNGSGTLTIKAESTYTGDTTVNNGTLEILADAGNTSLNSSDYFINNGSTLQLNDTTANHILTGSGQTFTFDANGGGSLTLAGTILWRDSTIATTGGARNTVSGSNFNHQNTYGVVFDVADGTDVDGIDLEVSSRVERGSITKNGDGTVLLTNNANNPRNDGTAVNSITINGGTLEVGSGGQIDTFGVANGDWTGAVTLNNDGIFKHSSTQTQALSGTVSGTGSIEKIGGSALTLSGNSTYSGTTTIGDGVSGSVIRAGSTTGLSSASAFTVNANGTLILDGFDNTIGSLAGAGAVRNDSLSSTATLTTGGDNSSTTYSGVMTDGAGALALSLVKEGTGTMTMTGVQQYTGTTDINAGTLLVNGSISNSSDTVTVNSGGTLGGDGTIGGATTFTGTGALAPGAGGIGSIGTLTFNQTVDVTAAATAGNLFFDLGASGVGDSVSMSSSQLDIGTFDLTSFTFANAGYSTVRGDFTWTLFDYGTLGGGSSLGPILDDISYFEGIKAVELQINGTDIQLFMTVPEPSSSALLGLGGLILAFRRKR